MSWSNDPELQELFRGELLERAERLIAGARAMQAGTLDEEMSGAMLREGHTIKGTGRVMGFEAISRAGQMLEQVWRKVQHGDVAASERLGVALQRLSEALPAAIDADPTSGTPEVDAALAQLAEAMKDEPEQPAAVDPADAAAADPTIRRDEPAPARASDLGGLLGALESWASEESVLVNAGRLYRLINQVAAMRIEIAAVRKRAVRVLSVLENTAGDTDDMMARLALSLDALRTASEELEHQALDLASVPLREITNTLPQLVRYLAKKTGKEIRFEMVGDDLAVDRQVLERLSDPLRQLVVNAIEHGIEPPGQREAAGKASTAEISVRASIENHRLTLVVEDDGCGIDWSAVHRAATRKQLLPDAAPEDEEVLRALLFAPGFSTSVAPSELVGDGVGLTKVSEAVEALYGSVRLDTEPGQGTRFTMTVPTARALQRALVVEAGGQKWGIPDAAIEATVPLADVTVTAGVGRNEMMWHDRPVPVVSFADVVGVTGSGAPDPSHVVVINAAVGPVGLTVERVVGVSDVAAKELGPLLSGPSHVTGAALLGDGDVVLLVDSGRLAERSRELGTAPMGPVPRVLVVDDSQGARQVVAGALASSGFLTSVAGGAVEALGLLADRGADAMVVDFSMPQTDGVELVEKVRRLHGDLPIVMLSGVATPDDEVRAKRAGVDAFFDKSDFREGALVDTLRSLLASRAVPSEVMTP